MNAYVQFSELSPQHGGNSFSTHTARVIESPKGKLIALPWGSRRKLRSRLVETARDRPLHLQHFIVYDGKVRTVIL